MGVSNLEREFRSSWDEVAEYYDFRLCSRAWLWLRPMKTLLVDLRPRGYHRKLRAGVLFSSLLLSRCKRESLVFNMPYKTHYIIIEPLLLGGMTAYEHTPRSCREISLTAVEPGPRLLRIIDRLAKRPVK